MRIDLSGKNIVVTDGARGLGQACVRKFNDCGGRVALVDVDFDTARESAALFKGATAHGCDLSDPADLTRLHRKLTDDFQGRIDILVNNAGIISYTKDLNPSVLTKV